MTCGAVFIAEFGERPDLDRLEVCTREPGWSQEAGWADHCADHQRQVGWLLQEGHLDAYLEQRRRFERQQHGGRVEQGALL